MTCRTYNPSVRVGNWNEDIQLEEDTLKDFLERRERGQLLIQRNPHLSQAKTKLSSSTDGFVHFGDSLMLVNPADTDSCLSACASDQSGSCGVSGSRNGTPCARNTFIINSLQGEKNGDKLTYNTHFHICCPQGENLLYLSSDHVSPIVSKSSCKSGHQAVSLVSEPSLLTAWKILYFDPQSRLEMDYLPVLANTNIILTHVYTNRKLCVEYDFKIRSAFGSEYEISAHDYLDSHKAEKVNHHWKLTMNVPGSDVMPIEAPAPETS